MGCFANLPTNINGIPYLQTTNTTVGATTVDLALGSYRRPLPPAGYFTVRIAQAIPTGTTDTLPVTLTRNGTTLSPSSTGHRSPWPTSSAAPACSQCSTTPRTACCS